MNKLRFLFSLTVISVLIFSLAGNALATGPSGIVYEAEFQKVFKQHADKWAEEDKQIERRLEALRKKHGKRPNIIHIMWDDMKYGAIGHDMLNKVTGYSSPNINKLAAEGMTFTRMYTEPSCTPTRVAAATGRQPVRSGIFSRFFRSTIWACRARK
jgi:arylsulfatase